MKAKFYNETEKAAEKEILDDSKDRLLFVMIAFFSEGEKGGFHVKSQGKVHLTQVCQRPLSYLILPRMILRLSSEGWNVLHLLSRLAKSKDFKLIRY